jgi:carboxyl-terminal processing protease
MIKKIFTVLFILFTLSNIFSEETLNEKTKNLLNILNTYHYKGLDLNEKTFNEIKKSFLDSLDPHSIYFSKEDAESLLAVKLELSDFDKGKSTGFYDKTVSCYKLRLKESIERIKTILKDPSDYETGEILTLFFSFNKEFLIHENEMNTFWKKWLKYKILEQLYNKNKNDSSNDINKSKMLKNEIEVRNNVIKEEVSSIEYILNTENFDKNISVKFLNAISMRFDPHTEYFSKNGKEGFETTYSKDFYSFGISFKKDNDGSIKIGNIVPGSSAWKSFKMNKDDTILEIKVPEKNKSFKNLSDANLKEIDDVLNDTVVNKLIIKIKKKSGLTEDVTIYKEITEVQNNAITGFILTGKEKIGYINLPSFYTDWYQYNASGCANDIAKEIIKMQKENIAGLIIDIRNNGGGSINEAFDLAGIFIDEGPLCIQGVKDKKPVLIKDINRGTIFDGPLLVMINEYTASSSELLASALKDYNRAIIAGKNSYGKATSQMFFPVVKDYKIENYSKYANDKKIDFVKVTTNEYYNLTGNTHQKNGIPVDINLPGYNIDFIDSEKNTPFSFDPDIIKKNVAYNKNNPIPVEQLAKSSISRLSNNKNFQKINIMNQELKKYFGDKLEIPLNINNFIKTMQQKDKLIDSIDKSLNNASTLYKVENSNLDKEILKFDKNKSEMNINQLEEVQDDIYIEESYQILSDYIKLLNK